MRPLPAEGDYTFRVRAIQSTIVGDVPGPARGVRLGDADVVDRTAPAIASALSPASPNGDNGWYRSLTVDLDLRATGGVGHRVVPGRRDRRHPGRGPAARQGRARDRAGNLSGVESRRPPSTSTRPAPSAGPMRAPSPGAIVAAEPTFVWGPAPGGETSGFNRYEVMVRIGGHLPARRAGGAPRRHAPVLRHPRPAGLGAGAAQGHRPALVRAHLRQRRQRRRRREPVARLPHRLGRARAARRSRAGPSGPTNVAGPTFTWNGTQPSFAWERVGGRHRDHGRLGQRAAEAGLLPRLPDGDYTFAVSQVTGGRGPAAPRRRARSRSTPSRRRRRSSPRGRPSPRRARRPAFSWTTEPGAFSRWRVIAAGRRDAAELRHPADSTDRRPARPTAPTTSA